MPARTPRAAIEEYRDALSRIIGCVTDQPLIASPIRGDETTSAVEFAPHRSIARLRRQPNGVLGLVIRCAVRPVRWPNVPNAYAAEIAGYAYQILDSDERELMAYHWHPGSISPVDDPHLHLTSRTGRVAVAGSGPPIAFGEMHVRTGLVTPVDVVRMLIEEFAVAPRRSNWKAVVGTTDQR